MTESDLHFDVDLDVELDPEDLAGGPPVADIGDPCLVVDDLHVVYRVIGSRGRQKARASGAKTTDVEDTKPGFFRRLVTAGGDHVGAYTEVHAVRGVSFVAHHGESIGIVGVNGSGKSTLLRAVAGLIPPKSGSVHVAGEPALLGVNAALMPQLSGERNIMIGGLALGLTEAEVEERFDEIVEFADIGDFVYLPMKTYSSGMAARLRFAISSAAAPDILMIDEALATGDATFKARSKARIDEIREDAGTVFLVSHSVSTIEAMCTRVLWLHKGQLVMDGPTEEVTTAYRDYVRAQRQVNKGKGRGNGRGRRGGGRGRRKNQP
ncbi:ABC transporter ATP-binding protein [Isoptericola haloaureus]|uniref:ABC transporter ATP-binding protein n=1 Tax=Isoptericola haloaureus TaxID=1542902 RepID=A0ABU7Z573_9MICO